MRKFNFLLSIVAAVLLFTPINAFAKQVDLSEFNKLPILEDGRLKPLQTYAKNLLIRFSGRKTVNDLTATEWFAELLFTPEATKDDPIFLINHPEIMYAINVEPKKRRRYSFNDLEGGVQKLFELSQAAFKIEPDNRDIIETEILRVFDNLELYSKLTGMFDFARTTEDFTLTDPDMKTFLRLPSDQNEFSYLDFALRANQLHEITSTLSDVPQTEWRVSEYQVIQISLNIFQWSQFYEKMTFPIIPSFEKNDTNWFSPWDIMTIALTTESGRVELTSLQRMHRAFNEQNPVDFNLAIKEFNQSTLPRMSEQKQKTIANKFSVEVFFNELRPFYWAQILFIIVLFLFFISFITSNQWLYRLGAFLTISAITLNGLGLILRIIILSRPPVSNLYETFIFVSFISALLGLIIEKFQKNWIGLMISSISGIAFLSIAHKFALEGDTLEMLVAVLNSNFWLSTHVTTITIGYAGVCVAGIVGHIYLLQRIFKPKDKKLQIKTLQLLLGTNIFGLLLTFLGTNLGGIWADQSWGRFWGWDPKENGALLIIIWSAIILHARMGKMIGPIGFAVGSIINIMVVMWAWFGVNLLSVGLHSYGFTAGLATNLTIYFVVQSMITVILTFFAARKV